MKEDSDYKISHDIIECSYYAIDYFQTKQKEMTNLKLQKIMYLTECYFMAVSNKNELYNCEWLAWNYGPVSLELYNKYKIFEGDEITLNDNEKLIANSIPEINKIVIQGIYTIFGQLAAYQLVDLTHEEGSPWYQIASIGESQDVIDEVNHSIDKKTSKEWFNTRFKEYFDGKKQ